MLSKSVEFESQKFKGKKQVVPHTQLLPSPIFSAFQNAKANTSLLDPIAFLNSTFTTHYIQRGCEIKNFFQNKKSC